MNYTKPVSPSGLKKYHQCPFMWADNYVHGNKPPAKKASDRGTDLHAYLEEFFRGNTPFPSQTRALRPWQRFMESLSVKPNVPEGEVAVYADWRPTTFDDPEANYRGKYDLKVQEQPRVLDIFDWKSGRIYPDHEGQGLSYCAMEPGDYDLYRTHFVYLDIPTHVESREYISQRIAQERVKLSAEIQVLRLDTEYRKKPGPHCNYCHLSWRKGGECRAAR